MSSYIYSLSFGVLALSLFDKQRVQTPVAGRLCMIKRFKIMNVPNTPKTAVFGRYITYYVMRRMEAEGSRKAALLFY